MKSFLLRKGLFIMQLFINVFFFTLWNKFGETRQKVVALIATTLKAPLSVAKASGRISGRKFYTGNINYIFLNILAHINSPVSIKKVRNRSYAPKNANSDCCYTKPDERDNGIRHTTCWNWRFYQIQKSHVKKRYNIPSIL